MLTTLVLAMLAANGPRLAVRPGRPDFRPDQLVCKFEREPSSRLAHRKVCRTAAEWEEERRIEQGNLRRQQYNGAQ